MIVRIVDCEISGPSRLRLSFNNGQSGEAELKPWLIVGTVFEPLNDPIYFEQVELDRVAGTVVWPNGADFAPEALLEILEPTAVTA